MRKYILLLLILCLYVAARGQTASYSYEYWFDNDRTTLRTGDSVDEMWQVQADVSTLSESLHTIHIQVRDTTGQLSSPLTRYFVKQTPLTTANWRFWFDNDDTTEQRTNDIGEAIILDVSHLSDGFHLLHAQVDGSNNTPSVPIVRSFIKVPQVVDVDYLTCLCMIDNQLYKQERVSAQGGMVEWQFDVSDLPQGFHQILIQAVTPSGAATSSYRSFFIRETTSEEYGQMRCVYAIDGSEFYTEAGAMSNGTYHFDLDVAHLSDGLHSIAYMLSNGNGVTTKTQTQFFVKTPLGGNGIADYYYWLNEQNEAEATKVVLSERQDPYSLISLLPVSHEPIRSSCFEFRIEEGQPVLYAKNDFHIRFHDASGRFTDACKQYVDEQVRETVTDVTLLESGISQTTTKPVENTIKWYMLEAEPGDSVQFKTSRTCTLQLFSPSGEEVYSASGMESTQWGGCHAEESGTFYLALHDVTSTQGTTVSIDYNHIDKYAVLRQDVSVVGNGGCSTITFEGNGFYNLRDITMVNGENELIQAVNIEYLSNTEIAAIFDFRERANGKYDAVFDFTDETRNIKDAVTIEKLDSINLVLKVENANQFLRGSTVTYTIKVMNTGNSTAYRVPIEIQLLTQGRDAVSYVKFSENIPTLNVDGLDSTMVERDSIAALKAYIAQQGDLMHFMCAYDSIDRRYIKDCHLAIDIAPKSTYVIRLMVKSSEAIELQAVIPSKWIFTSYDDGTERFMAKARRAGAKENMCCIREKVECVMNVIVGALDFVSIVGGPQVKIADCIASLGNTTLQYAYDVWCGETLGGKNPRKAAEDLAWDAVNGLIGCICGIPGVDKLNIQWIYQHIYNNISTTMDCVSALTQKIPNCPPNPDGGGGTSSPVSSFDPNDIYGYVAESGSKAVKTDLEGLYYTIQFENDTTFATAAAHEIFLADTLDASRFDLSTFAPTRIKIGEKTAELTGEKNFVTTIDLRPEINAVAQVEGSFDEVKGIARWHISSLDPMTMEPTDDPMEGILPVNYDGSGIGEVSFDIALRSDLAHGMEVKNRAAIVFDTNDAIMTPYWTNVIDKMAPVSHIKEVQQLNDSTATVAIEATDELSGPWRYDVYVQYGAGSAWWKAAERVPADSLAEVKVYPGIDHGFYVVVTDSAGNVEQKEPQREYELVVGGPRGDVNQDGQVTIADVTALVNIILGKEPDEYDVTRADVNGDGAVTIADVTALVNIILGK